MLCQLHLRDSTFSKRHSEGFWRREMIARKPPAGLMSSWCQIVLMYLNSYTTRNIMKTCGRIVAGILLSKSGTMTMILRH